MRHLKDCQNEKEAQAIVDALEVGGVECTTRDGKLWSVWVYDDDLVDKAEEILDSFDPDKDYSAEAGKIRKTRDAASKPIAQPKLAHLERGQVATHQTTITWALILGCVATALTTSFGEEMNNVFRQLLVVPSFEVNGVLKAPIALQWEEPWRLITPMFLHFGLFHLGFNMMWFHLFGTQIESGHGVFRFVLLIAVAQIAGSIAQFSMTGPLFGGMSGVNYALFGFVWMQSRSGNNRYQISSRDTILLMGWLILCATGWVGPVANACHAIGLAVGLLAGLPAYLKYRKTHSSPWKFEKGSWADLNIHGWQRFVRLYVHPYVPAWFMAAALLVLFLGR